MRLSSGSSTVQGGSSRPFAFRIESAATCNLRCPLCSTTYRDFSPGEVRPMTVALFRTILDKIRKHAWRITFYMEGEPMMNPGVFEMIELSTRDRHLFTSFSTNDYGVEKRQSAPLSLRASEHD
jgi:MoaA/NifB/PqqE/SkfB family radical SAM enzyme